MPAPATLLNPGAILAAGNRRLHHDMKIATWNVNSIRQREAHVQRWLQSCAPDILILQEIKCEATAFPGADLPRPGLPGRGGGAEGV